MRADAGLAINSLMKFRLGDVFFPETEDVLAKTSSELNVIGRVIGFSDSGSEKSCFAIVEVDGIDGPVIVPVERLRPST